MLEQRIEALTKQYEEGLKNGTEFSVLKDIRDQLKLLKKSLGASNDPGEKLKLSGEE